MNGSKIGMGKQKKYIGTERLYILNGERKAMFYIQNWENNCTYLIEKGDVVVVIVSIYDYLWNQCPSS
jgi:hypothetical protein